MTVGTGDDFGFGRWRAVLAALVGAAVVVGGWYQLNRSRHMPRSTFVDVSGRQVGTGVVPTRTEPSFTSPQVFHPQQTAKPATSATTTTLRAYSVTLGADAQSGTAVLGPSAESARRFVVGAILENGAVLSEVYADRVVLERSGQRYTLYAVGAEPSLASTSDTAAADVALRADPRASVHMLQMSAARTEDMIRFTPARSGSEVVGLTLYPGMKDGYFERWGLKQGDVLVSLSDVPSGDVEGLTQRLAELAAGKSMSATVRRGSELVQVLLDGSVRP